MEPRTEVIQENVAGLYFRSIVVPRGIRVPQHVHPYDHATLVAQGAVSVEIEGSYAGVYSAGTAIEIKAHQRHEFVSLEDDTRLVCIHHTESAEAAMLKPPETMGGV